MRGTFVTALALTVSSAAVAQPVSLPSAIYTDPVSDPAHPARMEVLHVPSGNVAINGVAYLAAGPGVHPTVVICHGLPGNEKNLDLAQAVRRAGWNAITFNYRGSWGSPGNYRFTQNPEDAKAVLAFLRDPKNAAQYGIDAKRIAIVGHSMGGWVAATVGGQDGALLGVGMISSANMGKRHTNFMGNHHMNLLQFMAESMESLAGVTAKNMADEVSAQAATFDFVQHSKALASKPMLILTSDDGLAPESDELAAAIRAQGSTSLQTRHVATDHSWSDRRIALQASVINWLQSLLK